MWPLAPFHVCSPLVLVCSSIFFTIYLFRDTPSVINLLCCLSLCLILLSFFTFFYWTSTDCVLSFIDDSRSSSRKKKSSFFFHSIFEAVLCNIFHLLLTFLSSLCDKSRARRMQNGCWWSIQCDVVLIITFVVLVVSVMWRWWWEKKYMNMIGDSQQAVNTSKAKFHLKWHEKRFNEHFVDFLD